MTGCEFEFRSIRSCSDELGLNRKTITSILKNEKSNNYDYDFKYKSLTTIPVCREWE
ncbi:MAG: hypothetical protein ACRCZ0_09955 [Cetobacterium sp.]